MSAGQRWPQLAHFIERRSPALADTLLRARPAERRTVGAYLRATDVLDALVRTLKDGDAGAFTRWLDGRMHDGVSDGVRDVLPGIWSAVGTAMDRECAHDAPAMHGALRMLRRQAADVVQRYDVRASAVAVETMDETDAAAERMVAALDERSPLTAEHSRAVSAWCMRIARRLSLSAAECNAARRAGLIHDVGKALTPNQILEAPRRLTAGEWTTMQQHTTLGADMVAARELLHDLIPAVRHHHERLDGTGYPDGLRGCAIGPIVRIVTVADCFNAMVGRRPYRPPLPPTHALDELIRHRGTQFDPDVVEAMIDVVNG